MPQRTARHTLTTAMSAVLLVLQALAGGAVSLAHAGEPETAPSAFEAHNDSSCIVIHDAMRCALCLYANSLTTPPPAPRAGVRTSPPARTAPHTATLGVGSPTYVASRPRAPPSPLS